MNETFAWEEVEPFEGPDQSQVILPDDRLELDRREIRIHESLLQLNQVKLQQMKHEQLRQQQQRSSLSARSNSPTPRRDSFVGDSRRGDASSLYRETQQNWRLLSVPNQTPNHEGKESGESLQTVLNLSTASSRDEVEAYPTPETAAAATAATTTTTVTTSRNKSRIDVDKTSENFDGTTSGISATSGKSVTSACSITSGNSVSTDLQLEDAIDKNTSEQNSRAKPSKSIRDEDISPRAFEIISSLRETIKEMERKQRDLDLDSAVTPKNQSTPSFDAAVRDGATKRDGATRRDGAVPSSSAPSSATIEALRAELRETRRRHETEARALMEAAFEAGRQAKNVVDASEKNVRIYRDELERLRSVYGGASNAEKTTRKSLLKKSGNNAMTTTTTTISTAAKCDTCGRSSISSFDNWSSWIKKFSLRRKKANEAKKKKMESDYYGKNRATGDKDGEKKRVSTRSPLPPPPRHSLRTTTTRTRTMTSHGDVVDKRGKGDEMEMLKDFGADSHGGVNRRVEEANCMNASLAGKSRNEGNNSAAAVTAAAAAAASANKKQPSTPSSVSSPSTELLKQKEIEKTKIRMTKSTGENHPRDEERRRPYSANAILERGGDAVGRKMTSTSASTKMKTTPTTTTSTRSSDRCAASPTPSSTAEWVETASSNLRLKREVSEKVFETAERLAEVADSRTKELNALEEEFKRVLKELECYKRFEAKTRTEGILRQETIKNLKWTVVQEMKHEIEDIDK